MWLKPILIFLGILLSFSAFSGEPKHPLFLNPIELTTTKTGLLIGFQQGQFPGIELGMERQWKQLKLKKPRTVAVAVNAEYLFETNHLGFRVGPWVKFGRMDFTYGVDGLLTSDFENARFGITPKVGFKLLGFHVIAGYNILPTGSNFGHNKLHLSVRYFLSKSRSFDIERSNKKKKKKK